MKISFIGGGNMARALISGMLRQGFDAAAISVVDPDADKRASLQRDFGVTTTAQLPSVSAADVIVLAVKPQQLRDLSIFLGSLLQHQLVISIAAGIRCNDLARWLGGYAAIVRVMPNTPAQVQRGLSALFAMPAVSATQRAQAEQVLQAVGKIMWLDAEAKMDAVTAISGSGPAYVFYFMEALQQAAVELGFTEDEARMLTLQTFSGASALADASAESAAVLRQQVTSKGGTTEQALLSMEDAAVKAAIVRAAHAAAERSRTLGDQLGRD
ncbi:MAG TPA: pyrroline-5-carboxylate reductase [Methylophilaceae bacterium]|nr:pyrroline-5-carboxylate reductase [Methylophilaceae bacterium]